MGRTTFKKIIVTDDKLKKVNKENSKLAERFLKEKNTRSSDKTIQNYKSDLDIFFCWNLDNNDNKAFVEIRKIEFSDFFSFATEELQWGSARFNRCRATLSSFSNFIEKYYDDMYPKFRNVILKTVDSMPNNPVREKTILSEKKVDELKEFLKGNEFYEDLCLLCLGIGSGARIAELLRFETTHIDENNLYFGDMFMKTTAQIKTKGRTKQGKMLYKFILKSEFIDAYRLWLPQRQKIMDENGKDHNFIFIDKKGNPATEGVVRSWSKKWESFLGEPFYFHALRHYIVTHLTRIGVESDLIVSLMGWSTTDMVKIYNDLTAEDREWEGLDKLKEHFGKK